MIGFIPSVYTVRKSEGSVVMVVGVVQGQLGAPVTVTLSTYSGTATGDVIIIALICGLFCHNISIASCRSEY